MSMIVKRKITSLLAGFLLVSTAGLCLPAYAQQLPDYTLNPGDEMDIAVWKEIELTKTVIVRPDGKFSFPLAGEIQAVGRSVSQVQAEIAAHLTKYIPDPVVT